MHDLPFNRELTAGNLRQDRFQHYLIQDGLYLTDYARALAVLAAKAPNAALIAQFASNAAGAVHFEQEMQQRYLSKFGVDRQAAQAAERSPTCLGYTSFLLAEAQTGSYETLLAALLPCFSVYAEVGAAIARQTVPDNPFSLWIDTYASGEFQAVVDAAEKAANEAAEGAHADLRRRMLTLFRRSVEFEWMFWDAAHRLEAWPTIAWR
ncbi:MAG: thiaminase II [Proteobacteria bacterium]|nr:thiaminase II [Pseudomonadota bacterium]